MVRKKDSGKVFAMKVLKKEQVAQRNLMIKTKGKFFKTNIYNYFFILAEREILEKIRNPFIVDLYYAF
jgi:serine/threonine protein kinase